MDGIEHVHHGQTGAWIFHILRMKAPEGGYSAVADSRRNGMQECKLVLTAPHLTQAEGDEVLKRKCVAWIEKAEAERSGADGSVAA